MRQQEATGTPVRWDAGDIGCGQLAVGLRREIGAVKCGEALTVVARNEGAAVDVPAWCRVTGHELVSARPPIYVIQKNGHKA